MNPQELDLLLVVVADGIAARLGAMERELARLGKENGALQSELDALREKDPEPKTNGRSRAKASA